MIITACLRDHVVTTSAAIGITTGLVVDSAHVVCLLELLAGDD